MLKLSNFLSRINCGDAVVRNLLDLGPPLKQFLGHLSDTMVISTQRTQETRDTIRILAKSLSDTTSKESLELVAQLMCFYMCDDYQKLHVKLTVGTAMYT